MIILQFSAESNPGSWAIRKFTWSPYSHVDGILPDGRWLGARFDGGVQARKPYPVSRSVRFAVAAPDAVLDAAMSQIGKPYDWRVFLSFALHRDWQDPGAWFCSELWAWAFQECGRPLLRADHLDRITPRDLLLSPYLEPVPDK